MLDCRLTLQRKTAFYFYKIYLVMMLLLAVLGSVFFLATDDLSDRTNIIVTLILAAVLIMNCLIFKVALNFAIATTLPKVSYNTKMDYYLGACYVFMAVVELESVVVFLITNMLPPDSDVASQVNLACGIILAFLCVAFHVIYFAWNLRLKKKAYDAVLEKKKTQ